VASRVHTRAGHASARHLIVRGTDGGRVGLCSATRDGGDCLWRLPLAVGSPKSQLRALRRSLVLAYRLGGGRGCGWGEAPDSGWSDPLGRSRLGRSTSMSGRSTSMSSSRSLGDDNWNGRLLRRAPSGPRTRSMFKLKVLHLSCDREVRLRGRHFIPFSCYCRSCGPLLIRLKLSLAALRYLRGYVLVTLIVGMATTAHEDQGECKTDDHAGDGADDDAHRAARLGCQCTGQLTGRHERH